MCTASGPWDRTWRSSQIESLSKEKKVRRKRLTQKDLDQALAALADEINRLVLFDEVPQKVFVMEDFRGVTVFRVPQRGPDRGVVFRDLPGFGTIDSTSFTTKREAHTAIRIVTHVLTVIRKRSQVDRR